MKININFPIIKRPVCSGRRDPLPRVSEWSQHADILTQGIFMSNTGSMPKKSFVVHLIHRLGLPLHQFISVLTNDFFSEK
jgi:hypothetical protein